MRLVTVLFGISSVALLRPASTFLVMPPPRRRSGLHPVSHTKRRTMAFGLSTDSSSNVNEIDTDLKDTPARTDETESTRNDDVNALRNEMMVAASANPSEDTAKHVETLLLRMVDCWYSIPNASNAPTAGDFDMAITAWSNSCSPETARRVGMLYFEQEALYEKNCVSVQPTAEIVSKVLAAMSSSRERGADRRAWAILERLPLYDINATVDMYTSVIRSLARSRDRNAAERAEGVLKDAIEKFPPAMDEHGNATGMTVDSFNVILTAWAKSGREDGPKRAEELLVYMDQVHKQHGGEEQNLLKPNVSSFTSLIDAYAQTNDWAGVSASERMLNRLLEQYLEGDDTLEPNVASWTIVISAWTRLARKNLNRCAQKADTLLRRMEELYEQGRTSVAPDAITYITVMNAHAASKSPNSVMRAQDILDEMHERFLDGEDEMKVSTKSIKVIIDAWIKTDDPNAMENAEAVLDKYEEIEEFQEPIEDESVCDIYRSMLFGWTKHGDPRRAEKYLRNMISLGLKPDCFCFDRIIESYTQLNAPDSLERTYGVFELMEQCRKEGDVEPNERVYTSFIRALNKAKVKGLAKKATTILKKMNDLYKKGNRGLKPTTFTYNAVLNACAESIGDDDTDPLDAFKVAIGIFNDLRNSNEGPDHVTFGNMLRCAALLPEGEQRDTVAKSTFQLCCKRGFVNSYVVRDLQYTCDENLWRQMLKCPQGDVDCDQLPASWRSAFVRKEKPRGGDNRPALGRLRQSSSRRQSGRKFSGSR